jgi:hypothetical protein
MQRCIATVTIGLGLTLAACSQGPQTTGTTGAIAPGQTATGTAVADASSTSVMPQVDKKSCEEIKVEMTAFQEAKIPQKLEQFGQSKYTPTADELPRFQRYVEVNQAMKSRCASMLQAEKPADTTKKKKKTKVIEQAPAEPAATDSSG